MEPINKSIIQTAPTSSTRAWLIYLILTLAAIGNKYLNLLLIGLTISLITKILPNSEQGAYMLLPIIANLFIPLWLIENIGAALIVSAALKKLMPNCVIWRPALSAIAIFIFVPLIIFGLGIINNNLSYQSKYNQLESVRYDFSSPQNVSQESSSKKRIKFKDHTIVWTGMTKKIPEDNTNLWEVFMLELNPETSSAATKKISNLNASFSGAPRTDRIGNTLDEKYVYWIQNDSVLAYERASGKRQTIKRGIGSLLGVYNQKLLVQKPNNFKNETDLYWLDIQTKELTKANYPKVYDFFTGITLQDNYLCYVAEESKIVRFNLDSNEMVSIDYQAENNSYNPQITECQENYIVYKLSFPALNIVYKVYDVALGKYIFEKNYAVGDFHSAHARLWNGKLLIASNKQQIIAVDMLTNEEKTIIAKSVGTWEIDNGYLAYTLSENQFNNDSSNLYLFNLGYMDTYEDSHYR